MFYRQKHFTTPGITSSLSFLCQENINLLRSFEFSIFVWISQNIYLCQHEYTANWDLRKMHRINISDLKRSNVKTCTHYGQVNQVFLLGSIKLWKSWWDIALIGIFEKYYHLNDTTSMKLHCKTEFHFVNKKIFLVWELNHKEACTSCYAEIYSNISIVGCYLSCLK